MTTVLVVDDDTARKVVTRHLRLDGHEVLERADGLEGLAAALSERPDLVVPDLMMPGMDGLVVCQELRRRSTVAVIMLTAVGEDAEWVVGLAYAADDYVIKPFSPRELAVRVAGVLQRSDRTFRRRRDQLRPPQSRCHSGTTVTSFWTGRPRTVTRSCRPSSLTVREFDLLTLFLSHRGTVFSRIQLMEQVWNWTFGDESTVTVHVARLRAKIEPDPASPVGIVTVWGVGYRYDPSTAADRPAVQSNDVGMG